MESTPETETLREPAASTHTQGGDGRCPLAPDLLRRMDAYRRAANTCRLARSISWTTRP